MRIPTSAPIRSLGDAVADAKGFDAAGCLQRELSGFLPTAGWAHELSFEDLVLLQSCLSTCASDPRAIGMLLSGVLGTRVRARFGRLRRILPSEGRPIGLVGQPLDDAMRLGGGFVDGSRELVVHSRPPGAVVCRLAEEVWFEVPSGQVAGAFVGPGRRLRALVAAILPAGMPVVWHIAAVNRQRQRGRLGVSTVGQMRLSRFSQ